VERAAGIMGSLFAAGPRGRRVADLSEELELHKTTVVRLLRTLVAVGLVRKQGDTNRYCWDPFMWMAVVSGAREMASRADTVQRALTELAEETGQIAALARPDAERLSVSFVAVAYPRAIQTVHWHLGTAWPAHLTASGKVLLAEMSEEELDEWIERAQEMAEGQRSISPKSLHREIARCRKLGYGVKRGGGAVNGGVAVAVRDQRGDAVGAVALTVPLEMVTPDRIRGWVPRLRDASAELSCILCVSPEGRAGTRGRG
jgi:DNA-binding IclR family transcriptional regulator